MIEKKDGRRVENKILAHNLSFIGRILGKGSLEALQEKAYQLLKERLLVLQDEIGFGFMSAMSRELGYISPASLIMCVKRLGWRDRLHVDGIKPWERTGRLVLDEMKPVIVVSVEAGITLDKIGKMFGVTRERIRQIYNAEKHKKETIIDVPRGTKESA